MRRLLLEARACWLGVRADRALAGARYGEAAGLVTQALGMVAVDRPAGGPSALSLFNRLGMIRKYQGRFAEGRRAYRLALEIARSRFGRRHPVTAALYHNLGGLEHARGRYARAAIFARHGLAIRERALGPDHVDVARDRAALAAILDGLKRHDEAEALHREALEVFRRRRRPDRRDVATTLANLAASLHQSGRDDQAEPLAATAVARHQEAFGIAHPATTLAIANLAVIRRALATRDRA